MIKPKTKDPDARLDYGINWAGALDDDTIVASEWFIASPDDDALEIDDHSFTGSTATVWLTGGLIGTTYSVTNRITSAAGRIDDWTIRIIIKEQ